MIYHTQGKQYYSRSLVTGATGNWKENSDEEFTAALCRKFYSVWLYHKLEINFQMRHTLPKSDQDPSKVSRSSKTREVYEIVTTKWKLRRQDDKM